MNAWKSRMTIFTSLLLFSSFLSPIVSAKTNRPFLVLGSQTRLRPDFYTFRGGSTTPFQPRVPPTIQGRPGRHDSSSSKNQWNSFASTPGEESFEDEASTKEMIDSFLTRDSRNSFIGTSVEGSKEGFYDRDLSNHIIVAVIFFVVVCGCV